MYNGVLIDTAQRSLSHAQHEYKAYRMLNMDYRVVVRLDVKPMALTI